MARERRPWILPLALALSGCGVLVTPPAHVRAGGGLELGEGGATPFVRLETLLRPTAFERRRQLDVELGYVLEQRDPEQPARHGALVGTSVTLLRHRSMRLSLRTSAEALFAVDQGWQAGTTAGLRIELLGWVPGRQRAWGNLIGYYAGVGYGEAALGVEIWGGSRLGADVLGGAIGASITIGVPATIGIAGTFLPLWALLGADGSDIDRVAGTGISSGDESFFADPLEEARHPRPPGSRARYRPVMRCWLEAGRWQDFPPSDATTARRRCLAQNDVEGVEGGCRCERVLLPADP